MEARIRMADGHSGHPPTDGFLSDNPRMNGGWNEAYNTQDPEFPACSDARK
ncbi:hypothetical protein K435DRAFT_868382 [Dendrothele bispora CBS 962.96]|uniref:Uncharacterized protein n=1 Tax=Dendrothele bispora (strain CBS 962.96) TaxID=1314807 RepID=A0A4S8LBX4_DENBC|nr:hypothetical protein K435DRAFT_868382 [Dendrothele bispora CBS 962.96]